MSEVRLTRELVERGFSPSEIARLNRADRLERVRRGAYATPVPDDLDPRLAHLRLIEATVRQTTDGAVISHASAAALHGLPIWRDQLTRVHLTRDRAGGGRVRSYTHLHGLPLVAEDVALVDGWAVTSLPRTVLDLACSEPMARAVPVGDAVLRRGLDRDVLAAVLDRASGRHGAGAARRAIAFLDRASESAGESMSRVTLHELGLPPPTLQFEVVDAAGAFVGRSDFAWPEARTLGEFDGKVKYGRLLRPGQSAGDVVFDEKCREDALRDLQWEMVRWVNADLARPAALGERIRRAFVRGRRYLGP